MTATQAPPVSRGLREDLLVGARTLGTVTVVGVVTGWVVVGLLSRLAMFVLAELNPRATGATSDDGFVIGQFTLAGSANLMFLVGSLFGVAGAGLYLAAHGLMVGPRWFQVRSIAVGPGVVVGALIVHREGVDFTLLEPLWLAVVLFVAIPTIFVAALSVISERVLARERPVPGPLVAVGLACWVVVFPLLPLLLALTAGFLLLRALQRTDPGRRALSWPALPWIIRAALAVVFVVAVGDLAADVRDLS